MSVRSHCIAHRSITAYLLLDLLKVRLVSLSRSGVRVARAGRGVDAALALLELRWGNLGRICPLHVVISGRVLRLVKGRRGRVHRTPFFAHPSSLSTLGRWREPLDVVVGYGLFVALVGGEWIIACFALRCKRV